MGQENSKKEAPPQHFIVRREQDIEYISPGFFKILQKNTIKISQNSDTQSTPAERLYSLHECNCVLFSDIGDPLAHSLIVLQNDYVLNNSARYRYLLVTTLQQDVPGCKAVADDEIGVPPVFVLVFANEWEDIKRCARGYQYAQELKGNIKENFSTNELVQKIKTVLKFDYRNNFAHYFDLHESHLGMLLEANKRSRNYIFQIVALFIFETTIVALHRTEVGQEFLKKKGEQISKLAEQDFSKKFLEGVAHSNRYFWKTIEKIDKEGFCFELQQHKSADSNEFFKGVTKIMRKISPFSPHTMLYRIIVSPADAPKNQFTEIFQNDSLEELNKCMENIKKEEIQKSLPPSMFQSKKISKNMQNSATNITTNSSNTAQADLPPSKIGYEDDEFDDIV